MDLFSIVSTQQDICSCFKTPVENPDVPSDQAEQNGAELP